MHRTNWLWKHWKEQHISVPAWNFGKWRCLFLRLQLLKIHKEFVFCVVACLFLLAATVRWVQWKKMNMKSSASFRKTVWERGKDSIFQAYLHKTASKPFVLANSNITRVKFSRLAEKLLWTLFGIWLWTSDLRILQINWRWRFPPPNVLCLGCFSNLGKGEGGGALVYRWSKTTQSLPVFYWQEERVMFFVFVAIMDTGFVPSQGPPRRCFESYWFTTDP